MDPYLPLEDVTLQGQPRDSDDDGDPGCLLAPPPCCANDACRARLEEPNICRQIGACGVGGERAGALVCGVPRHRLMAASTAVSVCGVVLSALALCRRVAFVFFFFFFIFIFFFRV